MVPCASVSLNTWKMPKSKTLSEKLAELTNPKPRTYDPEDDVNEESVARLEAYEDEEDDSEVVATTRSKSSRAVTTLRHRNAPLLSDIDKRYIGKKVSRKQLEECSSDSDFSSGSKSDTNLSALEEFKKKLQNKSRKIDKSNTTSNKDNSSEDNESDELEFQPQSKKSTASKHTKFVSNLSEDYSSGNDENEDESDEDNEYNTEEDISEYNIDVHVSDEQDGSIEDEDEEQENSNYEDDTYSDEQDEDEELEEEMEDKEDTSNSNTESRSHKNGVDNSGKSDFQKGKAVKNQLSLWDHLLECRIKLHKGILLSNQLPHGPDTFQGFLESGGKSFESAVKTVQDATGALLNSFLELQNTLLRSNPQTQSLLKQKKSNSVEDSDEEIPSDTEEEEGNEAEEEDGQDVEVSKRKRMKLGEYENEIKEHHERYQNFRNQILQLWNEKTRLAYGRSGNNSKSGFGAFEQSILKQIEVILADKQRLLNRTRIKRTNYRILGSDSSVNPKPAESIQAKESGEVVSNGEKTDELDVEIYDDDDFYHQLLREFIERKTVGGGSDQVSLGRQWLEIQKLRSKAKRKVDPKASKGRRLRFQVHPKLVSFMAPYQETSWNDLAKNELYNSLFSGITA